MSTVPSPSAGWYPDPSGSGALRWWDGMRWTEHVAPGPSQQAAFNSAAYAPARRRPLPAETPLYTVWIWLVAILPLVSTLLVFLLHPQPAFRLDETGRNVVIGDPLALLGGPMYFVVVGIGWLLTAAGIVFSWLDYRELVHRGVERPFHWAWSFLGIVYPIGRSVVIRGVTGGRGLAPMWVSIGVYVAALAVSMIWSILLVSQILGTIATNVPAGA